MGETASALTVYFEGPFWVGVFERTEDGRLTAAKVTFGGEPRDGEIYEFILRRYGELEFSPAVAAAGKENSRNPKRARREARERLESAGVGTKAQQALKLQREQSKTERKRCTREEKQEAARLRFEQKQQKKKEKHRGR